MVLSFSNIAWDAPDNDSVLALLAENGVDAVEVAPSKVWPNWEGITPATVRRFVDHVASFGLRVSSFQAIVYGKNDLCIFGDDEARGRLLQHLHFVASLAEDMGAGPLVFGAPRNRQVGSLAPEEAQQEAIDFFRQVAESCHSHSAVFCIEPNPKDYQCDFVNTAKEGAVLVRQVNHPGFRLHLDAAGMFLSQEQLERSIGESADVLAHFHMSEPFLSSFAECRVPHQSVGRALRKIGYHQCVAIEMRRCEPVLPTIEKALLIARKNYIEPT